MFKPNKVATANPCQRFGGIAPWLATLCLLLSCSVAWGQVDAITVASYDLRLAFTVDGKVDQVPVKAGDRVKAGALLMSLVDLEGEAMVLQYTLKANSDLGIRSAKEQLRLAKIEVKAIQALFEQNAATPIELDRAIVKAAIAELEVENAQQQFEEAKLMLTQASSRHAKYKMYAPIDGFIDTLVGREGEGVEALKPVLRLVNTDVLYIDAAVSTSLTLGMKPGDKAWITLKIQPDAPAVAGKILYMAQVADSASDTRIVRVEMPNPKGLPAGGAVTVYFTDPQAVAAEGNE